jgi:hypothetical protein
MPIKVIPFENPFRNLVKDNGDKVKIVEHKGQKYEIVGKKCQHKI